MRGKIRSFDRTLNQWLSHLPQWLKPIMLAFTALGHPVLTVGIAAVITGIGIGNRQDSLIIAGSVAIIVIAFAGLLKLTLRRKRPLSDYVDQMFFDTFSFPSGHAAGAMASYGMLAVLAIAAGGTLYITFAALLVLSIFIIGASRVFLKAHFPSDVLGGWLVGLVGLIFIALELLK